MERSEIIQHYRQQPEVDVLIIGAGINGIGTFRDLGLQGVSVLMVDRSDLCSGASATSTRLAHGGIRYLENGEFRLVRESLLERNLLLRNAPHAVYPLLFTIPLYSHFSGFLNAPLKFVGLLQRPSERGSLVIRIGLFFYDWFTRKSRATPTHKMLSRESALKKHPGMNPQIVGAGTYYDAVLHYAERIAMEIVLDAEAQSDKAHALTYVSAADAAGDTVQLKDELSGETFDVKPRIVINAGGPWIDFVNRRMNQETRFIGGTKGSHIMVDHPELHRILNNSALYFENKDGRLLFVAPMEDRVQIGTTDIRIEDPDDAICTDEEIDYFFTSLKHVIPGVQVDRSHIVFHFSGVRPLPSSDAGFTGMVSRDHSIRTVEPDDDIHFPIHSLIGGKWTTYRAFAEQVTDKVLAALGRSRQATTEHLPIGGGAGYPQDEATKTQWIKRVSDAGGLPIERVETLLQRYGTRAEAVVTYLAGGEDRPLPALPHFSQREIMFIALNEKVVHLDDVLLRRTLLALMGRVDGAGLVQLADAVGAALGWSAEQKHAEIERTAALLQRQHGVSAEKLQPATADVSAS